MRIQIRHQMSVTPPAGTSNMVLQVLATPKSGPTQKVADWSIEMEGFAEAGPFTDAYGNMAQLVNVLRPEGDYLITISGLVDTNDRHGVLGKLTGEPVPALFKRQTALTKVPVSLYGKFRTTKDSRIDVLHALMARVGETLATVKPAPAAPMQSQSQSQSSEGGSQSQSQSSGTDQSEAQMLANGEAIEAAVAPAEDVLPLPPASDYAHAFIGAARGLDIPARFVTGYLLGDEDHPASFHAWAEAYDEGLGWIGFDPMMQLCPTDRHVRMVIGLDALTAQPIRVVPAGDGVVEVDVSVTRAE